MTLIRGAAGAAALAFAGLFALPASAQQVYDKLNTSDVTELLKSIGLDSKVDPPDEDYDGDYVTTKYGKISYWIHFTECNKGGTNCATIVFDAGFSYTDKNDRPTLEEINDWNEYNIGKAGLDKNGDPYINVEVHTLGGLTRSNLIQTVTWWEGILDDFTDSIGWS